MPPNTVKVDRTTKWGNPMRVGIFTGYTAANAVDSYRRWLKGEMLLYGKSGNHIPRQARRELRGKNLACWCKQGAPCHADVLLEIANS
jgi:hypothetical protein